MHPRGLPMALFLATIVLTAGLLTGCGGGDQSKSGSQQGGDAGQNNKAPEKQAKNDAPEKKVLIGKVAFVNPKTEGFSVRPNAKVQGNKPVVLKLAKNAEITLGGKEAKFEDMQKGQQAQVEYFVMNERNRARTVRLFDVNDTSGEPSNDDGNSTQQKDESTGGDGKESN
jgi:hypothetical protein